MTDHETASTPEKTQFSMRYFVDDVEVSEAVARRAEERGAASVAQGGSGVVPERLREPGETPTEYLRPWVLLLSTPPGAEAPQ